MTKRLYYQDCYLREFRARVIETADDGRRIYLDRTAFYPTSGGQPFDVGTLGGVIVREVVDEDDRIAHVLDAPLERGEIEGQIDWNRRFDHMQQHTGQHLLSAVFVDLFNIPTVSFHMGAETSTIDLRTPALDPKRVEQAEERCAAIIGEARPVGIAFEDASSDLGLRKASERTGTLRIISIDGIDRSACGGTHVRSTAEIGSILIRKLDKMRGNVRLEFVCGLRAVRQARRDFHALSEMAAAQADKTKTLEKTVHRLATELAQREGRELYASATPDGQGVRRLIQRGVIDEAMRTRAQAFTAGAKAAFLAVCEDPPSVLLAASADSGIHAGERIKTAVTRGGGNQALAQGSVPNIKALESIAAAFLAGN